MKKVKHFFTRFFKEYLFCGLDIGSQKIKACLSRVQDAENLELLAVNDAETKGLKDVSVNDIAEFSSSIGATLEGLTKKTRIKFHDVYLGIGGDMVETRMSKAVIPLTERGNKVITPKDVKAARRQARLLGTRLDEEVICDFVRHFKVDDVSVANNPVGLYGRKIEVEVLLVLMNITRLRNISKAVRQSGYEVNNIFFNAEVLAEAVLDRKQKTEGCVLVDIGAKKTEIMVFKDGLLKSFNLALFGGDRMSQKIAGQLSVPFALAEDLKKTYAQLPPAGIPVPTDEILIKKDQGFIPIKREVLIQAVADEVEVLLNHIRDAIAASGCEGQLKAGIVMSGGGVLLSGLMERVELSLKLPVSMTRNIPGLNNSALYTTSISLAQAAYKGSLRYAFDTRKPKDWLDAFKIRIEEFFNEYF